MGDEATCVAFKVCAQTFPLLYSVHLNCALFRVQKGKVYIGTDMHALQIYSVADHQPDGIVSRFTANVTHISINRDGTKIAAGSWYEYILMNLTDWRKVVVIRRKY